MKNIGRVLKGVAASLGTAEQVPPGGASDSHRHTYESLLGKPAAGAGAGVTSYNGRVGIVVSIAADIVAHSAALLTSGLVALARGGTNADNSARAANEVFAGPAGGPGAAAWRILVAADIPALDTSKLTTGQLGLARGGTGVDASTAIAANAFFGGPVGAPGAAAFRALLAADIPNLDTAKVTTGRFTAPRMLDGANGLVFMGKGAGADPAYTSRVAVRLTADNAAIAAAAPTTALQVANLIQAAVVGDEWDIEWILDIANSVAADVFVFNVTSTAGTLTGRFTVEGTNGVPNLGAGVVKFWSTPAGTLTIANANAPGATGTIGLVLTVVVRARVKLTVAPGNIQLLLRAGTNAAAASGTATVKAQSQMIARKVA